MDDPDRLLTPDDVAKWFGVKRKWVIEHTSRYSPIIPHVRIGRAIRFRRDDIERFLSEQVCTTPSWTSQELR